MLSKQSINQKKDVFMGIKLSQISDGTIEVISRIDDAIVFNEEAYGRYLETLDESNLTFVEGKQPTKFVMRKVLPYKLSQKVQNKQLSFDGKQPQLSLTFMAEEVRCSLITIKNPDYLADEDKIKFEKSKDDEGASDDLIAKLISCGIAQDLYVARQVFKTNTDLKKS
jgi:hypothetical protein